MIKRIIGFFFLGCLIIAIPLAIAGIKHVDLGGSFMTLLRNCDYDFKMVSGIEIPNIPDIPKPPNTGGWWEVLGALIDFFNFIILLLNVVISVANVLIGLIKYIIILVKNIFTFRDTLISIGERSAQALIL